MRSIVLSFAVLFVAACTTPEPKEAPLKGTLTLSAGPCRGFCPVYTMRLGTDDRYILNSGENTVNPGKSLGAVPVGSFRKALEALDRYEFRTMETDYTENTPANCPEQVSDTPTIKISRVTENFRKIVTYNTGCLKFPDKDRLDQLSSRLRQLFRIDARVSVGEPPKPET